jgi:hypothetical protein
MSGQGMPERYPTNVWECAAGFTLDQTDTAHGLFDEGPRQALIDPVVSEGFGGRSPLFFEDTIGAMFDENGGQGYGI